MSCSPQRYLANNRNLVRTATLTPSSVLPVADSILEQPVGRDGTGQVLLTGAYSGQEEAVFDIEVLDTSITVPLISAPIATGAGSGTLSNISSSGAAQTYTLQLQNAGIPELEAGIDFEGVRIVARAVGAAGNGITIDIDQTTLGFTAQPFSLLTDLNPGDGAETTGLQGPEWDWDTKVLSANDIIPANAHRVAFGNDKGAVYLAYKKYVNGDWFYHFVPAIKRHIPKGTQIFFVSGGRAVTVTPLVGSPETFTNIQTVYDLLNAFFTTSTLVTVNGVIAYDRSPTGQASKELLIRTDAHCEPSTGTGSSAATGFIDTFANSNAATELVVARCTAVSPTDHPLARVGFERWDLNGSVSGALGTIVTGEPFTDPGLKFGLTIPQVLPANFGAPRGRFSVSDIRYVTRDITLEPPICVVAMGLGPNAVDQTITLTWTQRPPSTCACAGLPVPRLSKACLGSDDFGGGSTVGFQADTITRLTNLWAWYATTVTARSVYDAGSIPPNVMGTEEPALDGPVAVVLAYAGAGNISQPVNLRSIRDVLTDYESVIAALDVVADTTLRSSGMTAWDAAAAQLESDVDGAGAPLVSIPAERYESLLGVALISGGLSPSGKADASILTSGDGCWRDLGGDFWKVVGAQGEYAPWFNNVPNYSSRLAVNGKQYFSTKEFGAQINIKCPNLLVYGDQITLVIGGAGWGSTYQVGDTLTLPVLAAAPLVLAGGQYGNLILDWFVSGSVDGPLPNFQYDPSMSPPGDYSQMGLAFTYTPGGIPNKAGDKFVFTIEGGHWRYRKDGGAWILNSPSDDIDTAVLPFVDGLSIQWKTGAYPSFVIGDRYTFRVFQPWAVSNLATPDRDPWKWDEAAPNVVIDLGSVQPITALALYRHTIPIGATILVEGGTAPGVYLWSQALTWSAGDIFQEIAAQSAQYLRLSLTGALGGGIAWFWAGTPVATSLSADVDLRRVYKIDSGGKGLAQGGNYLGKAYSGAITWTEAALSETDVTDLGGLLDWGKTHGDEAFLFVPNNTRPDEVYAAILAVDDVNFAEVSNYNRNVAFDRRYSIAFPFAGVWRQ